MSPAPGSPYVLPGTTFAAFFASDAAGRFLYIASQPFDDCHGCHYGVYELMGYKIDQLRSAAMNRQFRLVWLLFAYGC